MVKTSILKNWKFYRESTSKGIALLNNKIRTVMTLFSYAKTVYKLQEFAEKMRKTRNEVETTLMTFGNTKNVNICKLT